LEIKLLSFTSSKRKSIKNLPEPQSLPNSEGANATVGLVTPVIAMIASLVFLVILLYKRVNLGIALNATALLLAALALDWATIPGIVYETTTDTLTISVVLATFGIMLLSQLYKETGVINRLSNSIGKIIKSPKIVMAVIPAVIGLLPVAGGALMSAPLVDTEAEKLKIKPDKRAYINLWFRHTIFPVYPLSPPIIVTVALTGVIVPAIILRQIPVVIVMIIAGYLIGLRKINNKTQEDPEPPKGKNSNVREFLVSFSPLLTTIVVAIVLSVTISGASQQGFDVLLATLIGLIVLIAVSKLNLATFSKPFRSWGIYGITLAAYGAFLLRKTVEQPEIAQIFHSFVTNSNINILLLLIIVPAFLGIITGSPVSGVAISVPIFAGIFTTFPAEVAALIYISAYLGYTVAPTHLCFTFTADYFKCSLGKMYRYIIPSFIVTFATAILVYFLL
jgi:integral membrane protein (TIGR00529 family)